jgi:hypothetical protein
MAPQDQPHENLIFPSYRIPVISTAEVVCAEPGRIKMNGADIFFLLD